MARRAQKVLEKMFGLRGRLMLLVLLSLGPALALVAYLGWKQGRIAQHEATEHVAHVARLVQAEFAAEIDRARHALAVLGSEAQVLGAQAGGCAAALSRARAMNGALLSLSLVGATGELRCAPSGTPLPEATELALIETARRDESIVVGPYHYHSEWRRGAVPLAFLLPPRRGEAEGVLLALADPLPRLEVLARSAALPEGSVIVLVDAERRVLARYPDRERFAGQLAPAAEVFAELENMGAEARGIDGVERLWAFSRIEQPGPKGRIEILVGVPSAQIITPVRRETRDAYLMLAFAAGLLLWLSWVLGGRLLVRPVRRLARLTQSVADGDLAMRTGLAGEGGEIGELAQAFDTMAKRLEDQFEALNASRRNAARNEKMFRAVADQSTSGILLHMGGKMLYVNRAIEAMTDFSREELLQMDFWQVVHPDYQEFIRQRAARRLAGEVIPDVAEFPVNARDGAERWVGSSGTKIELDGQRGALITWWDITERRELEKAAREGERTLLAVMDSIKSIVLIHRGDNLLFVNDAVCHMTGRKREELLCLRFCDIFVAADRMKVFEAGRARLAGQPVPDAAEARVEHVDGSYRWVEITEALIDYQGQPAILGNSYDITERKRAQDMVEQILQGSPSPSIVLDAEHRVIHWNRASENAFDVPASEIVGTREQWRPFYRQERPVLADVVLDGAVDGKGEAFYAGKKLKQSTFVASAYEAEDFFPQFGSRGMWLHFTAAPLKDSQGRVIGAIETLQDVTDRRFAEDELRQAKSGLEEQVQKRTAQLAQAKEALEADNARRQEAERVLRAHNNALTELNRKLSEAQEQLLQSEKLASIGQLAAGVAHEINNPIGYVHSNLGSLANYLGDLFALIAAVEDAVAGLPEADPMRQRLAALRDQYDLAFLKEDLPALLEESKEGITRVKKIVQDLKDFSRVDTSQEWQLADLHAGLDSTLNIVRNEIKYKADVAKEYGTLPQVECLPSQLNQVFMNLLVNAAHAMKDKERGTITLRTGADQEGEVWVEVADDGCGIPPENLKRIFDPFFTTKAVGKGTGLGLSLSYGIVQKHQGRIEVSSKEGEGTTFRVTLPVSQASAAKVVEAVS